MSSKGSDFEKKYVFTVDKDNVMTEVEGLIRTFDEAIENLKQRFENKVEKLQRGDELAPGVMKVVKVFIAAASVVSSVLNPIVSESRERQPG